MSAHRAFPAIVALWFAALLGIGSMVLPVTLFERLAQSSGLSSVVVAAQAPLGVTARIFIALAAAATGALAGLALARRVAAAHGLHDATPNDEDIAEPAATAAKRPISAHAEFGFAGFDFDEEVADVPFHEPASGRHRPVSASDERARPQFFEPEHFEMAPVPGAGASDSFEADADPLDLAIPENADDRRADLADERADDPAPFPTEPSEEVPMTDFETQSDRVAHGGAETASNTATAHTPIVELVERFARALERHRTEKPAEVQFAKQEGEAVVDLTFALAPKVDAVTAEAPVPPVFQPLPLTAFDEDEEAEEANESYPSLLAMKNSFGLPRDTVRIEDEADGLGDPIEPVVAFPGQATRASAPVYPAPKSQTRDTERALREALEKLQRMSGAA